MSKEIEMYLEKNHLSYNSAIRNNVGELVGIGDLIDQNTKPLIDEITTLESQFEQSDKMYSDLLAKKDDFKLKWENAENEIAKLKASKLEILNSIKSGFEVQSDYSTQCNGYKYLCREIEQLKSSKSEASGAVEFAEWIYHYVIDRNEKGYYLHTLSKLEVNKPYKLLELYEIFKTRNT